eukprot:5626768-Pyramimonas_sp.AAC.1
MTDELVLMDIHIPDEAFQQNVFVRKEMIQVRPPYRPRLPLIVHADLRTVHTGRLTTLLT